MLNLIMDLQPLHDLIQSNFNIHTQISYIEHVYGD